MKIEIPRDKVSFSGVTTDPITYEPVMKVVVSKEWLDEMSEIYDIHDIKMDYEPSIEYFKNNRSAKDEHYSFVFTFTKGEIDSTQNDTWKRYFKTIDELPYKNEFIIEVSEKSYQPSKEKIEIIRSSKDNKTKIWMDYNQIVKDTSYDIERYIGKYDNIAKRAMSCSDISTSNVVYRNDNSRNPNWLGSCDEEASLPIVCNRASNVIAQNTRISPGNTLIINPEDSYLASLLGMKDRQAVVPKCHHFVVRYSKYVPKNRIIVTLDHSDTRFNFFQRVENEVYFFRPSDKFYGSFVESTYIIKVDSYNGFEIINKEGIDYAMVPLSELRRTQG